MSAYLKKKPKPSAEDLEASAGMSRAGTFRRLRPFLLGRPGVEEDVHYAGASLGWGIRYRQKPNDLCMVFLWPDDLFAVLAISAELGEAVRASQEISPVTKELLQNAPESKGERTLRLRLEDRSLVADFRAIVLLKGGGPPPRRRP